MTADYSDLFGARVLAWVGGATTALGVVLLFVLAANRGRLGPELRVALGALASLAVFATGLWMRRRFGTTYAALGAVGAGIAGGYATLLASAVLYEQLNGPEALTAAAAIAAVGAATAILWHRELIAGIGLIGAMLVPVAAAADIGFTALGTAFVALVLAAATAVGGCVCAGSTSCGSPSRPASRRSASCSWSAMRPGHRWRCSQRSSGCSTRERPCSRSAPSRRAASTRCRPRSSWQPPPSEPWRRRSCLGEGSARALRSRGARRGGRRGCLRRRRRGRLRAAALGASSAPSLPR